MQKYNILLGIAKFLPPFFKGSSPPCPIRGVWLVPGEAADKGAGCMVFYKQSRKSCNLCIKTGKKRPVRQKRCAGCSLPVVRAGRHQFMKFHEIPKRNTRRLSG